MEVQGGQRNGVWSGKLGRIVRWLLSEAAPVVESDDCNWKLVINGGPGDDVKAVIEQYKRI